MSPQQTGNLPYALRHAGKRQNHLAKERPGSMQQKGWRFFADDEDEFGLEDILQARSSASSVLAGREGLDTGLHQPQVVLD